MRKKAKSEPNKLLIFWRENRAAGLTVPDSADMVTRLVGGDYTCYPTHFSNWACGTRKLPAHVHAAMLQDVLPEIMHRIRQTDSRKDKELRKWLKGILLQSYD